MFQRRQQIFDLFNSKERIEETDINASLNDAIIGYFKDKNLFVSYNRNWNSDGFIHLKNNIVINTEYKLLDYNMMTNEKDYLTRICTQIARYQYQFWKVNGRVTDYTFAIDHKTFCAVPSGIFDLILDWNNSPNKEQILAHCPSDNKVKEDPVFRLCQEYLKDPVISKMIVYIDLKNIEGFDLIEKFLDTIVEEEFTPKWMRIVKKFNN